MEEYDVTHEKTVLFHKMTVPCKNIDLKICTTADKHVYIDDHNTKLQDENEYLKKEMEKMEKLELTTDDKNELIGAMNQIRATRCENFKFNKLFENCKFKQQLCSQCEFSIGLNPIFCLLTFTKKEIITILLNKNIEYARLCATINEKEI